MRFWDASALVPLCVREARTDRCRALYEEDPAMAVWWASSVECASAFARLARAGGLSETREEAARRQLSALTDRWLEVQPTDGLRRQALRLVRLHPLRSADALQLAAALDWSGTPASGELVTFDERLRTAARREGFRTP